MSNPINDAVETILNTRDFCGCERNALRMVEEDHGIRFTREQRTEIAGRVAGTWKESQVAAGAKILTSDERRQAHRDLETEVW